MKKIAMGCGVVAVLVLVAVGVGTFWAYRTARAYLAQYAELEQVVQLNDTVQNTSPYSPPADERLTAGQVERYAAVQRAMAERLGGRLRALEEEYEALAQELEQRGRDINIRHLLNAWGDIISLVVTAKEAQVEALNEHRFSLEEYHWVRHQVLLAMGLGHPGFNLEMLASDPARLLEALEEADAPDVETLQHNRALLEEVGDEVDEWLPLAFFGL